MGGGLVVVSAGHVGGTRGSGIVSSAVDVLLLFTTTRSVVKSVKVSVVEIAKCTN